METITIRPLVPAHLADAAHLLSSLNPETPPPLIASRLGTLLADHSHYLLFGAFAGEALVGVAGAWIATKIWCGRYLEIDNLVVDPAARSAGVGSRLIRHLEALAAERDCKVVVLDSYTANHPSHRLYHRLGFEIWGFHFIKPVGKWKGKDQHYPPITSAKVAGASRARPLLVAGASRARPLLGRLAPIHLHLRSPTTPPHAHRHRPLSPRPRRRHPRHRNHLASSHRRRHAARHPQRRR